MAKEAGAGERGRTRAASGAERRGAPLPGGWAGRQSAPRRGGSWRRGGSCGREGLRVLSLELCARLVDGAGVGGGEKAAADGAAARGSGDGSGGGCRGRLPLLSLATAVVVDCILEFKKILRMQTLLLSRKFHAKKYYLS